MRKWLVPLVAVALLGAFVVFRDNSAEKTAQTTRTLRKHIYVGPDRTKWSVLVKKMKEEASSDIKQVKRPEAAAPVDIAKHRAASSSVETKEKPSSSIRQVKRPGAAAPVDIAKHRAAFSSVKLMLFFVGYPRSCSTLLGTLLDAHPHVVLGNEYNFFYMWPKMTPEQKTTDFMYSQLLGNSILAASEGGIRRPREDAKEGELVYNLKNQWNGRYDKTIQVIGDKHAGATSWIVAKQSADDWLTELQTITRVPVLYLHIIRNPYDNIATIAYRSTTGRNFLLEGKFLNDTALLDSKIDYYFSLVKSVAKIREKYTVIDIHSIDLLQQPKTILKEICQHLTIECSDDYIQSCAKLLFSKPSQSRKNVYWTDQLVKKVEVKIQEYPFLKRYTFSSD
eukprot:m.15332 g.15332  ORF g.15332 m.15332 type:complete len:394 (+) comp26306_c0_seq3:51-1232(+)